MTHLQTIHLLEWGQSGGIGWVLDLEKVVPGRTQFTFHLQAKAPTAVFVKCAIFWRLWLRDSFSQGWLAYHTRRWVTLKVKAYCTRWAEQAYLTGFSCISSVGRIIDLARPKRFDYSRWRLKMRASTTSSTRWSIVGSTFYILQHDH